MKYKDFNTSVAFNQLQQLAENPYDLTAGDGLSSARVNSYRCHSGPFDLLYSAQRVDNEVLDSLQLLADDLGLVDQFLAMKQGKLMNNIEGYESEERQVLHTACRDLFSSSPVAVDASNQAKKEIEKLKTFLSGIENGQITNEQGQKFTSIIQVGIGGSDLGPRAVCIALEAFFLQGRKTFFIANVDPDDAAEVLKQVDLSRALVNVVSKSGTTLETLTNEKLVRNALVEKGLDPARHITAVTGKGSPMDDPANYLASFYMYDYIGGRYSTSSMVGGVTLGFALGVDGFIDFLRGANAIDVAAEERDIRNNMPLLMALLGVWNRNFLGHSTFALLPYSQALSRFPAHLQQCDMESNGKLITRSGQDVRWKTGPIVWGEPGTNGQHAFYQLLHQGSEIVPAEFIGFRQSRYGQDITVGNTTSQQKLVANMLAQSLALAVGKQSSNPGRRFPGNRPNSVLIADKLTPATMGGLLALYESRIVFQGFCWNINSFDQEGVQYGKILAEKLLGYMGKKQIEIAEDKNEKTVETDLLKAAGVLKYT